MPGLFFLYYEPDHYFLTAVSLPIWQFCKYVIDRAQKNQLPWWDLNTASGVPAYFPRRTCIRILKKNIILKIYEIIYNLIHLTQSIHFNCHNLNVRDRSLEQLSYKVSEKTFKILITMMFCNLCSCKPLYISKYSAKYSYAYFTDTKRSWSHMNDHAMINKLLTRE